MRPIVVGDWRQGTNARHRAALRGVTLAMLFAVGGAVAGCGSVSNGLPKGSGGSDGTGGGTGAGGAGAGGAVADAAVDHSASGGAPGAGGISGTGGSSPTVDASVDAPREGGGGCVGMQPSCAALHACDSTLASGNYMIAPDGPTDAAPVLVFCDMTVGGGGWTVIYLADGVNLNSTTIPYTVTSQKLRDTSTQALIAFRDLTRNLVASDTAVFDLPATWRAANPLAFAPDDDLTVSASVNGGVPALAKLRYGVSNFGSSCVDDWVTATPYGRVCLQGTAAAFYSGFTTATATTDFCALSTDPYSSRPCSDMIRFSIAVR